MKDDLNKPEDKKQKQPKMCIRDRNGVMKMPVMFFLEGLN